MSAMYTAKSLNMQTPRGLAVMLCWVKTSQWLQLTNISGTDVSDVRPLTSADNILAGLYGPGGLQSAHFRPPSHSQTLVRLLPTSCLFSLSLSHLPDTDTNHLSCT